jgi:cell division protein FtsW
MKHIGLISLSGLVLMIPVFFLKAYRIKRLFGWLTGNESSSLEINYQSAQSVISFGQGGLTGTGLGLSKQKFFFLPESHTDYILAIIGEEMGFLFVMIVISCLLIFVWRGLRIANRATNLYHFYLAIGITVYVGLYAFVNTMIVIGILPTTGLPLPFISYGGSQLIINMVCTGILLNISATQSESTYRFAGSET